MNNFETPNSAAATFNLYSAQEALKKAEQEEAERRLQPIVNEMRAQNESLAQQVELLKKEDARRQEELAELKRRQNEQQKTNRKHAIEFVLSLAVSLIAIITSVVLHFI